MVEREARIDILQEETFAVERAWIVSRFASGAAVRCDDRMRSQRTPEKRGTAAVLSSNVNKRVVARKTLRLHVTFWLPTANTAVTNELVTLTRREECDNEDSSHWCKQ